MRRAATPTQVLEAVDRARSAQVEFGASSFQLRRSILNTLLDWIIEHQDMLCRVSARDTGRRRRRRGAG